MISMMIWFFTIIRIAEVFTSVVASNPFTEFQNHVLFPGYKLRLKDDITLLDPGVQQYTGYVDTPDNSHFFFWFIESRRDPKNDPIIMWLNGGPGCSSLTGLLMEIGPALITDERAYPIHNPFSWNNEANVLFLDQPVFAGFSYNDNPDISLDTKVAAKDMYSFLHLFFEKYPQYANLEFIIAGESYAGRYIPEIAKEIMDRNDGNDKSLDPCAQRIHKDLRIDAIMIGNGITDAKTQMASYDSMVCGQPENRLISDDKCKRLKVYESICVKKIGQCYEDQKQNSCLRAIAYCSQMVSNLIYDAGNVSPYDVKKPCTDKVNFCYPAIAGIKSYFENPKVREYLGVDRDWAFCSSSVLMKFTKLGDEMLPDSLHAVEELANKGIKILIFAGDLDLICNYIGNANWVNNMTWTHTKEYQQQPFHKVRGYDGQAAGELKYYENVHFYRVYGAGHMVPFYKPENSYKMLKSFLADKWDLEN